MLSVKNVAHPVIALLAVATMALAHGCGGVAVDDGQTEAKILASPQPSASPSPGCLPSDDSSVAPTCICGDGYDAKVTGLACAAGGAHGESCNTCCDNGGCNDNYNQTPPNVSGTVCYAACSSGQ